MKAVRLLEYGGQLVFDVVPMPTIARDEIPTGHAATRDQMGSETREPLT